MNDRATHSERGVMASDALMLRSVRAVVETLDPATRAENIFLERDLQSVFIHNLQPHVQELWEIIGPEVCAELRLETDLDAEEREAVAAAATQLQNLLRRPLEAVPIAHTARLAAAQMQKETQPPQYTYTPRKETPTMTAPTPTRDRTIRVNDVVTVSPNWFKYDKIFAGMRGVVVEGQGMFRTPLIRIDTVFGQSIEVRVPLHYLDK